MKKDRWPIDGKDHHDLERAHLYTNESINSFLDGDQHTILIATKGMGKTLLLRVKKKLLLEESSGTLVIPAHQEYDEPEIHGSIHLSGYCGTAFWQDVWECCIVLSILTYRWKHTGALPDAQFLDQHIQGLDIDTGFKQPLRDEIVNQSQRPPSDYLARLLQKGPGAVQKFLRSAHHIDALSSHFITNSAIVFIDGFDQALTKHTSNDLEVWRDAQLGLAKAVHRLNTKNRHIKVYASIRQEAYSGFSDDDREVIKGTSILLEHSKRELHQMLEQAVRQYTASKSLAQFLGVSEIENLYCNKTEQAFDYIYRHSAGTARSIIHFGAKLNERSLNTLDVVARANEIRACVNKTGSDNLYKDYLVGQRTIFLYTLSSEARIHSLLRLIPSNVLTGRALISICEQFAKDMKIPIESCHPFCELYNIGLLGRVRASATSKFPIQYFKKPYEFDWNSQELVTNNTVYLIHPSLFDTILAKRSKFIINPFNIIGDGMVWDGFDHNRGLPLVFLSHSSLDKPTIEGVLPSFERELNLELPCELWYDNWSIRAGGDIHQEVERGVSGSEFVLVFVSRESLKSGWVEREWRTKHFDEISSRRIQVIAIIIDETHPRDLPAFLRSKKAIVLPSEGSVARTEAIKGLCLDIAKYVAERYRSFGAA